MSKTKKSLLGVAFCLLAIGGFLTAAPSAHAVSVVIPFLTTPITDADITTSANAFCDDPITTQTPLGRETAAAYVHPVAACRSGFAAGAKGEPTKAATCDGEAHATLGANAGKGDKSICQTAYDKAFSLAPKVSASTSAADLQTLADAACQDVVGNRFAPTPEAQTLCRGGFKAGFTGSESKTAHCGSNTSIGKPKFCADGFDKGAAAGNVIDGAKFANPPTGAGAGGAGGASPTGGNPDALELDCDAGFNPLNWLICGAVKGMVAVLRGVDSIINDLLSIGTPDNEKSGDPVKIFATGCGADCKTGDAYHAAWTNFRNIALGLLVIAGLIMVMSQAIGMEILDAYTIRKVLPRLLIVSLLISISWPGLRFIVQLFYDLGYGVRFLIQNPFAGQLDSTIKLGGGQGTAVLFATPVAFLALGVFGLITFVGTALLAALIAFIVLILRQIVVTVLVIIAPVALVLYILPNTQKYWKIWMDSFGGALLMFPIISAIIAAGRVFAAVAISGGGDSIGSFIAFGAYFAPYFMIPATFKLAGGALRNISGAVNDRGRGGFDRLKKARQANTGKRIKAARSGGIYRDDFGSFGKKGRSIGKMANKFGAYTLDADEQLQYDAGKKGGRLGRALFGRKADIMESQINDQKIAHSRKAAQDMDLHYEAGRALGGQFQHFTKDMDADSVMALNEQFGNKDENGNFDGTWRAPEGQKEIEDVAGLLANGGTGAREASQELMAKSAILGSLKGPGMDETQRADTAFMGMMAAAQAGRLENEDIANNYNRLASSGDTEMAAKQTAMLQNLAAGKRTSQARGHGLEYIQDPSGPAGQLMARSVYTQPTSEKAQNSLMRMSTTEVANSKSEDLDETRDTWVAGASKYHMTKDATTGMMVSTGRLKEGKDAQRAEQLRGRIKTMATYNYGDSDVGRKLGDIYHAAGFDRSELVMQAGTDVRAREAQGGPPPPAPDPTGGQPPPGGGPPPA